MEEKKKNQGTAYLIVVLFLIIIIMLGLGFYMGYQSGVNKTSNQGTVKEGTKVSEQTKVTEKTTDSSQNQSETQIVSTSKKEVKVVDGIEYENLMPKFSEDLRVKIPQIVNGGDGMIQLNKKIASATLIRLHPRGEGTGITVTYNYKNINNVIVIAITEKHDNWAASGNGIFIHNYFYDVKNDKELEMYEALPLIGYTLSDIQKLGATSFEDFKQLNGTYENPQDFPAWETYLTIENDKITIHYKEGTY